MSNPHPWSEKSVLRVSRALAAAGILTAVSSWVCLCSGSEAQESRFSRTCSRSQYAHWIDLYDAGERKIDPSDAKSPPYSPTYTCAKCHDHAAIAQGHHFNAMHNQVGPGLSGEPWIWTDPRTGTQLPLSYRGWDGAYDPRELGISAWEFALQFGRHLPGGGPGQYSASPDSGRAAAKSAAAAKEGADSGRWKLAGQLEIDCMICHSGDRSYSAEVWRDQIVGQNFAWAPTAALGLAKIDGVVQSLPDDFDPAKAPDDSRAGPRLPKTTYRLDKFNADKKAFFDIVRKPANSACYYCHTTRLVGEGAPPQWAQDEDVHVRAGISCADCHRNGIGHDIVRGFEGEGHPSGVSVANLSCRGCHLDEHAGSSDVRSGRLGAPKPLHRGLPLLHLEKMSCTSCHSGPPPDRRALRMQTAMAHGLGLPSHEYGAEDPPGIAGPVLRKDGDVLYPYRLVWPAFWGVIKGKEVRPLHPAAAYNALRRTLRVRRGGNFADALSETRLTSQDKAKVLGDERAKTDNSALSEEEKAKLAKFGRDKKLAEALKALKETIKEDSAEPAYFSAGGVCRLNSNGQLEQSAHAAAKPYAWRLAHDVRPARWSSGAKGCFECHSAGAPYFEGVVEAIGPAPLAKPVAEPMYRLAGYDKTKIDAWNKSFQGRTAFKWLGFVSMGAVGLILLSYLLLGVNGLFGLAFRKRKR